ncbi:MAG: type II toxin-antitoxin system VapC family toxin [Actinobacteria bacterium]|nr:type II toxin-antitoxin system VapC family toxin [Actinomycetota bacterium]
MVIVDANVLLYAANSRARHHRAARRWLEEALNGDEPVGFAWVVLLAFIRITTLPAAMERPLSAAEAFGLVDAWLAAGPAVVVSPTSRHAALLRGFLLAAGTGGNLTSDAHLATLAVEHGARCCTFDRDFERFDGLQTIVPV